jgi:hypothetical protein
MNREPVQTVLTCLSASGLAHIANRDRLPTYIYAPATAQLRQSVDLTAELYCERPVAVMNRIYSKTANRRSFAGDCSDPLHALNDDGHSVRWSPAGETAGHRENR